MKRKITLSLAVVLLSLSLVAPSARGQQAGMKGTYFDTGIVTLGPGQVLRVTVISRDTQDYSVAFRRTSYSQGAVNPNGGQYVVFEKDQYPTLMLAPGEGAFFNIANTAPGVRGEVVTGGQSVRVTAQIIDTATGDIVAIWVPQGSPVVGK